MSRPRANHPDPLELLNRRWAPQILIRLLDGPQRFAQLAHDIPGVSRTMLSERLRELTAAGIITRHHEGDAHFPVSYSLTENNAELRTALRALQRWANTVRAKAS